MFQREIVKIYKKHITSVTWEFWKDSCIYAKMLIWSSNNNVAYMSDCRQRLDWGLDLLPTLTHDSWLQLNCSAIADLHTAHAKSFQACSIFISRSLVTACRSGDSSALRWLRCSVAISCTKSSLHRLPYNYLWTLAPVVLVTSRCGPLSKQRSLLYSSRFQGNMFVSEGVTQ
jgi:hypothetical protein